MAKTPTFSPVTNSDANASEINTAIQSVADQFENVVFRNGETPNNMQANLDMDSNSILNAGRVNTEVLVLNGAEIVTSENIAHVRSFETRADLVAWAGTYTPVVGAVAKAGGISWVYDGVSTAISDLPGWKPFANPYPDHWTENTTPRTTDMTSAFDAAIAYLEDGATVQRGGGTVGLLGTDYAVTNLATIDKHNVQIIGAGRRASRIYVTSTTGDVITWGNGTDLVFGPGMHRLSIVSGVERTSGRFVVLDLARSGSFSDMDVEGWYDGFHLQECARLNFYDIWGSCRGRTTKANNFFTIEGASGSTGTNIKFANVDLLNNGGVSGAAAYESGWYIKGIDTIFWTNCHANEANYGWYINADSGGANFLADLKWANCYADYAFSRNVHVTGSAATYHNLEFVNMLFRAAQSATGAVYFDTATTIENVRFVNCTVQQAVSSGINCSDANIERLSVIGCTFQDNQSGGSGFNIIARGASSMIANNSFEGGSAGGTDILVGATATDTMLTGNDYSLSSSGTNVSDNGTNTRRDDGPVASVTDSTAYRAMVNGSHGIGGNAIDVSDYDALTISGLYTNSSGSATGAPDTTADFFVTHFQQDANTAAQFATRNASIWSRRKDGGTWGAWKRSLAGGDLAAVSGIQFSSTNELTISSVAITISEAGRFTVDTEGDAATDDLDTISGGTDGDIIVITPEDDDRRVIVKNATGNIFTNSDRILNNRKDVWVGMYLSTISGWIELSWAGNGI